MMPRRQKLANVALRHLDGKEPRAARIERVLVLPQREERRVKRQRDKRLVAPHLVRESLPVSLAIIAQLQLDSNDFLAPRRDDVRNAAVEIDFFERRVAQSLEVLHHRHRQVTFEHNQEEAATNMRVSRVLGRKYPTPK